MVVNVGWTEQIIPSLASTQKQVIGHDSVQREHLSLKEAIWEAKYFMCKAYINLF